MGTNRRLMSAAFTSQLNEEVNEYGGQYVTAYATAPGSLMGEKVEGGEGPTIEEIVELVTFGQALNADGTEYRDEDGDMVVSVVRIFIPKYEIPSVCQFLTRAYEAGVAHPDLPKLNGEGRENESGS